MNTPADVQADIRFDQGRHHRAKIGYVLLATEQTIEDDVHRLTPDGVGVHFTRIHIPDSITSATWQPRQICSPMPHATSCPMALWM